MTNRTRSSAFYCEPEPARAERLPVAEGITRMVADNPSLMTYHGTNTWLVETNKGVFVVDPGPIEDETHYEAVLAAFAPRPAGILVTHHHPDHVGSAALLRAATGAPVYASSHFLDDILEPDHALEDGDEVGGLIALHTPGHASDHLCFATPNGALFTGDLVMTWSSSMVMLPDGDMKAYCDQLRRLLGREDSLYLPGHGPPLPRPHEYVRRLLVQRVQREQSILDKVVKAPMTVPDIAKSLYRKDDSRLAWAAERNVEAHLDKLLKEGRVARSDELWIAVE